mgnify:CR=1 FL=1
MDSRLIALCILAAAVSWLGAYLSRRMSFLVDHPNQRSSHSIPTPRSGGIGFGFAFLSMASVAMVTGVVDPDSGEQSLFGVLLVLTPIWIVGMIDDARGVSRTVRYAVQLASAVLAVIWFGAFAGLEAIPGVGDLGWLVGIGSVVVITALINFFNFMDGLDGLVGSTTTIQLITIAIILDQQLWLLLAAAVVGFLYWNWPPARVFMGDSGSTLIGGAVALALLLTDNSRSMWLASLVALPLVGDAVFTIARRLLAGENIFDAHRSHIYQRLNGAGWSHLRVTSTYSVVTLLLAALALILQ